MSYNSVRRSDQERVSSQIGIIYYGIAPFTLSDYPEFSGLSAAARASAFRRKVKHHAL